MTLRKRADTWVADLRAIGGQRLSLKTTDKAFARQLHAELERLQLRGEAVTSHTVAALSVSLRVASATVAGTPAPIVTESYPGAVTLRKAFDLAMVRRDEWRTAKSPKTIRANFDHVAAHFGAERPLASITSADMAGYRADLLAQGKSASTVNQRCSLMSVLFEEIEVLFDETKDPAYALARPRIRRVKPGPRRIRVLTDAEELRVREWFMDHGHVAMANLTLFLIDTGFRLSEALAVDPSDPRSVDFAANEVWARDTKNGRDRCVPMTAAVRDTLQRNGKSPLTVDRADKLWAQMRKAIGLGGDREFVIHALRHTCCTRMVRRGVDAFRVQAWMGHASITTTQIYVTLYGRDLHAVMPGAGQSVATQVNRAAPRERA